MLESSVAIPSKPCHKHGSQPLHPANLRWVAAISFPVISILLAVPWLFEAWVWCGWLAISVALTINLAALRVSPPKHRLNGYQWLLYTWLAGTFALGIAFYWAPQAMAYSLDRSFYAGLAVTIPILMWDALRIAVPIWLGVRLAPNLHWSWLAAGSLTVLMESALFSVFPWRLGYLQSEWPWTYQAADLFGPSWSTLTLFAHAGLIQSLLAAAFHMLPTPAENKVTASRKLSGWRVLGPAGVLCLANLMYSTHALAKWKQILSESPSIQVALLQVDPSFVESREKVQKLSDNISQPVDLVCWPESTAGTYAMELCDLTSWESIFPKSRDPERGKLLWPKPRCPLIVGGKSYVGDHENPQEIYVSAMLVNSEQQLIDRYHKRYLMPFGEYIPGGQWFPMWQEFFQMAEEIKTGGIAHILKPTEEVRLGAMLCYEDMIPNAAETLIDSNANLLACLINGASFDSPTTLKQHRKLAQFRAVESRRFLLRCASTGETCVVSPLGHITARLEPQTEDMLVESVQLIDYSTFYIQTRGLFPMLTLLTVCIFAVRRKPVANT